MLSKAFALARARRRPDHEDLAPAPGLGQLPALVQRVAGAGVHVDLHLDGVDGLPEGLAVSVYRIVQEALTNVVRHAAPADCRVTVARDDAALRVEVVDDGMRAGISGASDMGGGHGLIGMRERVRALGGEFEAGPLPQRGFRVAAHIPWPGGARPGGRSGRPGGRRARVQRRCRRTGR